MSFRCMTLLRIIRTSSVFRHNLIATSVALPEEVKIIKPKLFKTEDDLVYLEDPDNFGTLSKTSNIRSDELEDEDDIKEETFLSDLPLASKKLTIKQYADLIKQYLKNKRLKEAIDVVEIRMLKEDRVKPVSYIYNILIGACADVGYTKKAFKLYNEMKRRGLKPTGDTYTCLFNACANSPWALDGLKHAKHLRAIMIEKAIEPNLTNYNAMIKAFGWCGDLPTAFQIVDEMMEKKIKIRIHTFNHLLHACISDKNHGLRHALIVWRKMLKMREKPNTYTFNLMLKCAKDCNLGSKEDITELLSTIQSLIPPQIEMRSEHQQVNQLESGNKLISGTTESVPVENKSSINIKLNTDRDSSDLAVIKNQGVTMELVNKLDTVKGNNRTVPNLLSKVLNLEQVTGLQEVHTLQDKFAVIGGQEDFLKEMQVYHVKPNIKTFTQMLPLLDSSTEAEDKLLESMKSSNVIADIDFYNMLIKKRSLRSDYDAATDVMAIIKKESEFRKKRYPHSKKSQLKVNIMTYGVLAMTCNTKESAEKLLSDMSENKLKVNIEILGTLLRQGTANNKMGYVFYIMNVVKKENIQVNDVFLKHLESYNEKCHNIIKNKREPDVFVKMFENFAKFYSSWLKDINIEEVLKQEHPWEQFRHNYPETLQRDSNSEIKQPKKFYKRNRKYVPYVPKM